MSEIFANDFKVTNYIINSIDKFFIKNHFKERKNSLLGPENIFRSSWTYDFKKEWYNNKSFDEVKNSSLNHYLNRYQIAYVLNWVKYRCISSPSNN